MRQSGSPCKEALMSQTVEDRAHSAREAFDRHAWQDAVELFRAADGDHPLATGDLVMLAQAAWFAGEPDAAIEARERAHAAFLAAGEPCAAAEMALQLAGDYLERLDRAVGNGWLARARRLLDRVEEECAAHGWQALTLAMLANRIDGDIEAAHRHAVQARDIGERLAIPPLHMLAMQLEGATLVAMGDVDAGMALIDEATLAAVSGELDPYTTGVIYCSTISVCRDVSDWRRAGEWTDAAERWCDREGIGGFPGVCRIHRAEVMGFRGSWADAEREARRAFEELRSYGVVIGAKSVYEIAEVRRRVGDLEGAREAYRQAHEMNFDPEPGLALLRLAEGDVAAAQASIRRALGGDRVTPLDRVRMLPAAAEIGLAAGDLDAVRAAVTELAKVAAMFRTTALHAAAGYARGRLLLVEGDSAGSAATLRSALECWNDLGSPYEVARTRTALGEAYRAEGDEGAARLELEAAKAAFERLGAIIDAKRVDQLLGGAGEAATRAGDRVRRTFVFTDIVGSTSLAEALGDEAWQELIRWHDQTVRSAFDRHGGTEVRHTGDGFFVVFDSAQPAIEAAVALQRALAEQRRAHGFAPQVRVGLHEAEASVRGLDFAGKGVHEAARIGALAEGGEILASAQTARTGAVRFAVSEPRSVRLKGVSQPIDVVRVDWR
jgi:class 3 adenylate cyclase